MNKILVIGSINKDFTVLVDKAPVEGETIISNESRYSLGGKGANQAVALSRLGAPVSFIGKIGEDNNGYEAIESIQNDHVTMPMVLKSHTKDTGIAIIILEKDGHNRIIVNQGANKDFGEDDFEKICKVVDDYEYFLLQLEINVDFTKKIINYLKSKNKFIILNPAPAHYLDDEILKKINLIIPNEHEYSILTNSNTFTNIEDLKKVLKEKAKILNNQWIVTLGEKGALYVDKDSEFHCPAVETKVVDTTAAGDTFIGAFLRKYLDEKNIIGAMEFASRASAITISRKGAQESLPYINELL